MVGWQQHSDARRMMMPRLRLLPVLLACAALLAAPEGTSASEEVARATIEVHEPPAEGDAWYYLDSKGTAQGPLSRSMLAEWVESGQVPGDTQVKAGAAGELHAASQSFSRDFSKLRVKELRALLKERGVECKGCGENAHLVQRVQETYHLPVLPPPPPPPPPPPQDGGMPDLSKMNIPGMDSGAMERMMAEMKGDFSHVKDKRRRRALEKLKKSGMQVSGVSDMDIDQLENLVGMMEGGMGGMGGMGGKAPHEDDDL